MSKPARLLRIVVLMVMLFFSACNLPFSSPAQSSDTATASATLAAATAVTGTGMPVLSTAPATGDFVQILAINPPAASGLSPSNTVTLTLRYRLAANGMLQIWLERFKDPACTTLDTAGDGNTTISGGLMEFINSGSQETLVVVPPIPPMDATYVSVGARLWTEDASKSLAEDVSYANCYLVRPAPVAAGVTPGAGPLSSGSGASRSGTIAGFVYHDENNSGTQDARERGESAFGLTLADVGCIRSLASTTPDANGHFSFPGLAAGSYCVVFNYSGGLVAPGTWQRVDVIAGNSSPAFFGIQPARRARTSAAVCGNGNVETGEECDPPNVTNCTASCRRYIASCGNGIVDTGEQCDPPNVINCTASCQNYTAVCGNGIVDWGSGEQCDPPNVTDCTASCRSYTATCGNRIVDAGEQCDPPNTTNCTASCQNYTAVCGNGIVDWGSGEQCDPPNVTNCTASCQNYTAVCGNGIVDAGEQCDPPNVTNCTASCQSYTPVCGNGIVDWSSGEQCDPPNVIDCTASCQSYTPVCGNGIVDWGETCDPPNTTDCTASCQIWP